MRLCVTKSATGTGQSFASALDEDSDAVSTALRDAIREGTQTCRLRDRFNVGLDALLFDLQLLRIERDYFSAIGTEIARLAYSLKHEVLISWCHGNDSKLELIFFKHGGYRAVLALYLAIQNGANRDEIEALPAVHCQRLVKLAAQRPLPEALEKFLRDASGVVLSQSNVTIRTRIIKPSRHRPKSSHPSNEPARLKRQRRSADESSPAPTLKLQYTPSPSPSQSSDQYQMRHILSESPGREDIKWGEISKNQQSVRREERPSAGHYIEKSSTFRQRRTLPISELIEPPTRQHYTIQNLLERQINALHTLDQEATDLLGILIYLGPTGLTADIEKGISRQYICLGPDGNTQTDKLLGLSPVFEDVKFRLTTQLLKSLDLLKSMPEPHPPVSSSLVAFQSTLPAGPPQPQIFIVPVELQSYLLGQVPPLRARDWKLQACKLVCQIFPLGDEALPYDFAQVGRQLLPHADYILGYIAMSDIVEFCTAERQRFIEFCLSFSRLSTPLSKRKALAVAEMVLACGHDQVLAERLRLRKLEVYGKTDPSQASAKTNTNKYDGDAFILDITAARYALSFNEHVGEIWLTNRKNNYNIYTNNAKKSLFLDEKRRSFITLWISEVLGEDLGKQGTQMVDCTSDKEVQPTNNGNIDACLHD